MFDEEKPEPITSPDTDNATHFYYGDAPEDQQDHYRKLSLYNSGLCNGKWADQELRRKLDNLGLYDAISSELELTRYQKERGRYILENITVKDFGVEARAVIFCICAIVARDDGRVYHPSRGDDRNDDLFVGFTDDLSVSDAALRSCYNRVSEKIL